MNADSSITHCPQCGAELKRIAGAPAARRCEYCDASLEAAERPARPPQNQVSAAAPQSAEQLPLEYSRLKRPKPSTPLAASGCTLVFGLIWTVMSCLFMATFGGFMLRDYQNYLRLSSEGTIAKGTVTGLSIDDSGDSTSYYVNYRFPARVNGDASPVEARHSVSSGLYYRLEQGKQIDVRYVPADPNISAIEAEFGPQFVKSINPGEDDRSKQLQNGRAPVRRQGRKSLTNR